LLPTMPELGGKYKLLEDSMEKYFNSIVKRKSRRKRKSGTKVKNLDHMTKIHDKRGFRGGKRGAEKFKNHCESSMGGERSFVRIP